ncbi:MAG: hypothetical protein C5B54_08500 [Acidobacteria bacterium]|nr:MAG: hypothetical protein C5B54_08500 [Acidobacteriota bacterium]
MIFQTPVNAPVQLAPMAVIATNRLKTIQNEAGIRMWGILLSRCNANKNDSPCQIQAEPEWTQRMQRARE